ncbi:MAG: hypothetical protein KAQ71_04740 [Desulfobulbaceae bacterium]|nr:hypothetical protein [Desulfobulbaceae bacterium]
MIVVRLILLFLIGLVLRRVILRIYSSVTQVRRSSTGSATHSRSASEQDRSLENLTQQDVSDADFEEIP